MNLNAKGIRASLTILSAAALLTLGGCKDDVVDAEVGCASKADCDEGQICNAQKVCVADPTLSAVCGDGIVEGKEECDEGPEGNDGVTCRADCTLPSADVTYSVRVNSIALVEPAMHREPVDVCEDDSDNLNGLINGNVTTGVLNIVQQLVLPLPVAGESVTASMSFPATCNADGCEMDEDSTVEWTIVQATEDGPCFERVAATEEDDVWNDNVENELNDAEIPVQGENVCLQGKTDETVVLTFMGMEAPLNAAYYSLELIQSGDAPAIERGIIGGFITVAEAEALEYTNGKSLAFLLNGGQDNCVEGEALVALDQGPDGADGITDGWWLYVAFTGDSVIPAIVD